MLAPRYSCHLLIPHKFPHRSARNFRSLYTQRSSPLSQQISGLQQRLESVLKPPLRIMPTKPRPNFSRNVSRFDSTFDSHTNALESLNLCETQKDMRSQTPPPFSVLPSTSMTSHYPSSSPTSSLPPLHLPALTPLPPDNNPGSLGNVSTATERPQTSVQNIFDDINDHTTAAVETNSHDVSQAGDTIVDRIQDVAVSKPSVVNHSSGSLRVEAPNKDSFAEEEHWAAAVEYSAMHESNWAHLGHWKGFILWVRVRLFVTRSTLILIITVQTWRSAVTDCLANVV